MSSEGKIFREENLKLMARGLTKVLKKIEMLKSINILICLKNFKDMLIVSQPFIFKKNIPKIHGATAQPLCTHSGSPDVHAYKVIYNHRHTSKHSITCE